MTLLPSLALRRAILELILIVAVGLYATKLFANDNPTIVLSGLESQWLTSSAYLAADTLHNEGYLPRWQPWLGHGEPAIDNPFSFTLNPISMLPSLIVGAENGIKISVMLYAVFAGIGGWLLGRMLGLGVIGRLLLALLLIGRSNMHAEISEGYFQLGVTQAYFGWVVAATLAIIRFPQRRYPVVLLAIVLTLLFWAGNIYYTLPSLLMIAALVIAFMFKRRWQLDLMLLRRVAFAGVLTVGLAAVTLIPIFANRAYIGGHPDESPTAVYETPFTAAAQFFTTTRYYPVTTWHQNYDSFVLPLWFAALIFVLFPPISPKLQRFSDPSVQRRMLALAILLILFFLLWGTGTNPIMKWIYANLPLIGQWRVLSRMLTVSAFWIAVLAALRVDALWQALVIHRRLNGWGARFARRNVKPHLVLGAALIGVCALASKQVVETWFSTGGTAGIDFTTQICVDWLRRSYPDQPLAVFGRDYYSVALYIQREIRFPNINADFRVLPITPTIYPYDLTLAPPEYLISFKDDEQSFWFMRGYRLFRPSPVLFGRAPCLMRNADTLSYAFTIGREALARADEPLPVLLTTPITSFARQTDAIGLIVTGDPYIERVLVVQELAYPGWRATMDGLPAQLESVGGLIGVRLPQGGIPHRVLFVYDPPLLKLGGAVTLATALACALYLLQPERWLDQENRRRKTGGNQH